MKEIRTTVKLPPDLKKQVKIEAIRQGISFKDFYVKALREKLERAEEVK